jgi:cellulose synthase/poly-beta-1,6-N-acetylglucosamine synthase-like glycosyltransferase
VDASIGYGTLEWIGIFLAIIPVFLLLHTYLIYPLSQLLQSKSSQHYSQDFQPQATVLLAVFNEKDIIEQKMKSMLTTIYPMDRLQFIIGSDCSDDGTNEIIESFVQLYPNITFFPFQERRGKAVVMEDLLQWVKGEVIVFTDADTLFRPETISHLLSPFQDANVGGVQGNFHSIPLDRTEALQQESFFNRIEMSIKMRQSKQGTVIGAIGSIFAIRKDLYETVPYGIIVDDFFLFMTVLSKGYKTVFAEKSISDLYVSGDPILQFRRKKRIGSGNFMAYFIFQSMSWPWKGRVGYHFFSYKVLRWYGPFLMILATLGFGLLFPWNTILGVFAVGLLLAFDWLFRKIELKSGVFRYPAHFFWMNAAMFLGFFQYVLRGNSAVWNNPKKLG